MSVISRLAGRLDGPPTALPSALDRASERWWRLPPRVRLLALALGLVVATTAGQWQVARAQRRWGGPPQRALVAIETGHVGERPHVRAVALPPAVVPPDAPREIADDAELALALPRGAVLTRDHVSPRGPAVGLDDEHRVVPLPIPPGLAVGAGTRVDVWVLAAPPDGSRRIARGRSVVAVTDDDGDDPVALVALATTEVGDAMQGLADGEVVMTQAPP